MAPTAFEGRTHRASSSAWSTLARDGREIKETDKPESRELTRTNEEDIRERIRHRLSLPHVAEGDRNRPLIFRYFIILSDLELGCRGCGLGQSGLGQSGLGEASVSSKWRVFQDRGWTGWKNLHHLHFTLMSMHLEGRVCELAVHFLSVFSPPLPA